MLIHGPIVRFSHLDLDPVVLAITYAAAAAAVDEVARDSLVIFVRCFPQILLLLPLDLAPTPPSVTQIEAALLCAANADWP